MKNRQANHHLEINTSDIYCLLGNRIGMLLAGFVLHLILRPPTSPLNTITHYEKNFESFGSSTAAVPARHSFRLQINGIKRCCLCRNIQHGIRYVIYSQLTQVVYRRNPMDI